PGWRRGAAAAAGQVAGGALGADLGLRGKVVQVVLAEPARARRKVDVAAVGRELGAAVEGEVRRESGQRLELVAVEYVDMMVAGLDHDEQVERIGAMLRRVSERARVGRVAGAGAG